MSKKEDRFYRKSMDANDLVYFKVEVEQSDLYIGADKNLTRLAKKTLILAREEIKREIANNPGFLTSYYPMPISDTSSKIVQNMYRASSVCNVGPMAAVAGATAEYVGNVLAEHSNNVIVENGGDIFIKTDKPRQVMVYAGQSSLSGKIALDIPKGIWGVCTSAYSIGHSYSDGRCDAAIVISHDCALADAAATALGNSVKSEYQLERGVKNIMKINEIIGALAIINEKVAALGEISLRSV